MLTRHARPAALGSAPQPSGAGALGRRAPQLRHRRPQLGLSSSGEGEASAEPEAAAEPTTPEPESAAEEASETTPLVQASEETPEVKPESGAAEFSAAFYRTRLITFAAMVTGCVALMMPPRPTWALASPPPRRAPLTVSDGSHTRNRSSSA